MSEAHAKLHLREYVRSDDVDQAIDMMLESFLQSQKTSVGRQLRKKFEPYFAKRQDPAQLMYHTLRKLVEERVSLYCLFIDIQAIYEKVMRGVEVTERIEVKITLDQFEHEARDIGGPAIIQDFLKSSLFAKEYTVDGRHIKTTTRI